MVGVCMTVVSIVKLVHPGGIGHLIDKLLALDSIIFLASAILSFTSMRRVARAAALEIWAETTFLVALVLVAVASILLSFEVF